MNPQQCGFKPSVTEEGLYMHMQILNADHGAL